MKQDEQDQPFQPSHWSDMAKGIGWAFIWLGFGGCIALVQHEADKPLVVIEFGRETAK